MIPGPLHAAGRPFWAPSASPPSLIGPVTHPDVISREDFMHFNLTPLIIISRTSRFSLSSCPSRDKHNLFAIKPNKYVCAGDGNHLGREAPAWEAASGSHPSLGSRAGRCVLEPLSCREPLPWFSGQWPDLANGHTGQPAKFEFQMNNEFILV